MMVMVATLIENRTARQYTRSIVEAMQRGETPALDREQAGPFANILELLMLDYDPPTLKKFNQSLDALKNLHKVFKDALEETPQEPPYEGTLLSEVKPEKYEWLWKGKLARKKITMSDGKPGLGKSLAWCNIAARLTRGKPMPGEMHSSGIPSGVVMICLEDGLEDTIQPRLARAGADLTKIVSIGSIPEVTKEGYAYERPFTLPTDLPLLEKAIQRVNASLLIIDPIMGIMGSKDTYKDSEVRQTLAPIKFLIEKHRVACVMVRHVTKQHNDDPLMAGGGSIGFIGLARLGVMFLQDPIYEERVIFSSTKSNLSKKSLDSMTYTIANDEDQGDDRPYVVWGENVAMTASEVLSTPRKNNGGNRQDVLTLLKERAPDVLSLADIAKELPDIKEGTLRVLLTRMYEAQQINKTERGMYHAL